MSNLSDKRCFNSSVLNKSMQFNSSKPPQLFSEKNTGLETSFTGNKTFSNGFIEMLPRQSSANPQVNQLFKIPNFDHLPVKKATVKSIKSPSRRVQAGRVKSDLKGQQSKMSLIPRPSFINSRKTLHSSRCTQLKTRRELIKKMVFLAECSLKENKEIKQSTPVKVLAGLTPKKTPRSGGYFILPEFSKKVKNLEDIRSPLQELVKKEVFAYSAKLSPKKNEIFNVLHAEDDSNFIKKPKDTTFEIKSSPDRKRFTSILCHCKVYTSEVRVIHEKIKLLDDTFEDKLKNLPDYRVYNEFCFYQSKKEELYKELHTLELDLRNFISTHTKVGSKLKAYVNKKREFFEQQVNLHKGFENAVNSLLEKPETKDIQEDIAEEEKPKVEVPKLRRSLRLSKMKKNKIEERTPMTKRLKKLDNKSKGIQKSGKVRSP